MLFLVVQLFCFCFQRCFSNDVFSTIFFLLLSLFRLFLFQTIDRRIASAQKTNNHDLFGLRVYTDPNDAWEVDTYDGDEDEMDGLMRHMEQELFSKWMLCGLRSLFLMFSRYGA